MPSSRHSPHSRYLGTRVLVLALLGGGSPAAAEVPAAGFAVERLYQSAPGSGWVVMDALDMSGGLGGAISVSTGYAHDPLRITSASGSQTLAVVSSQAFADVGAAVTYGRLRLYLNLESPVAVNGQSGTIDGYAFTAPNLDLASHPDTLSDARLGLDIRLVGGPTGRFRLGAGVQVLIPSGSTADYVTDGVVRAMGRVLVAGDLGPVTYAGQLGAQLRTAEESATPGGPDGSELLFGAAAGPRFPLQGGALALIVGPELFGETAFRSFLGSSTTGVEGLLSARVEGTAENCRQIRVKVGIGAGLDAHFGAPEWRAVLSVEMFDRPSRTPAVSPPPS